MQQRLRRDRPTIYLSYESIHGPRGWTHAPGLMEYLHTRAASTAKGTPTVVFANVGHNSPQLLRFFDHVRSPQWRPIARSIPTSDSEHPTVTPEVIDLLVIGPDYATPIELCDAVTKREIQTLIDRSKIVVATGSTAAWTFETFTVASFRERATYPGLGLLTGHASVDHYDSAAVLDLPDRRLGRSDLDVAVRYEPGGSGAAIPLNSLPPPSRLSMSTTTSSAGRTPTQAITVGGSLPLLNSKSAQPFVAYLVACMQQRIRRQGTQGRRPRIIYLGTARGDDIRYITDFYKAFAGAGCDVHRIQLFGEDSHEHSPEEFADLIITMDGIFLDGGITRSRQGAWNIWDLEKPLRRAFENGAVVVGTSDGAIAIADEAWANERRAFLARGMGLIKGLRIVPHAEQPERADSAREAMLNGLFDRILALPQRSAAHFVNGKLRSCLLFSNVGSLQGPSLLTTQGDRVTADSMPTWRIGRIEDLAWPISVGLFDPPDEWRPGELQLLNSVIDPVLASRDPVTPIRHLD